jgi:hypothetical protein
MSCSRLHVGGSPKIGFKCNYASSFVYLSSFVRPCRISVCAVVLKAANRDIFSVGRETGG